MSAAAEHALLLDHQLAWDETAPLDQDNTAQQDMPTPVVSFTPMQDENWSEQFRKPRLTFVECLVVFCALIEFSSF